MNKVLYIASLLAGSVTLTAQISTNSVPQDTSTDQNVFMDAASNFNYSANSSHSIGKGLGFPQTDLSQFTFITTNLDGINYPSYFDGLVVYNIADGTNGTGTATNDPSLTVQTTDLKKGFYYFFNPNGASTQSISEGRWIRIGGDNATPAVPNSLVATGTFTHNGGNSAKLTNVPADIKAITGVKIVRTDDNGDLLQGGVAATTFYSYEKASKTIVFGQGVMSTSMPAGTYSYVIEYTK